MFIKLFFLYSSFFTLPLYSCTSPASSNLPAIQQTSLTQIASNNGDTLFNKYKLDTSLHFNDFESLGSYRISLDTPFFNYSKQLLKLYADDKELHYKVDSFKYYNTDLFAYMVFKLLDKSPKIQKNLFYVGFYLEFSKLISIETRLSIFNSFPPDVRNSIQGKKLYAAIQKNKSRTNQILTNKLAITDNSLLIKNSKGEAFTLNTALTTGYEQYLVVFWASWCSPCRYESKLLQKWLDWIDTGKVKIISISIDTDKAKWLKAVANDACPWEQAWASAGMEAAISKYFKIDGVPVNILLDKNKNIITTDISIELLKDKILKK